MARNRVDWKEFFSRVARPHGVRVRLLTFDSTAPESVRTEKRLVRLVKERAGEEPFALRRSYTPGPAIIDCVFESAALADGLAEALGAVAIKPPLGWATAREFLADDRAVRRIFKMGADERLPPRVAEVSPVDVGPRPSSHQASQPSAPSPALDIREHEEALGEAVKRLAAMSPDEQAAALFRSMTGGGGK